MADLSDLQKGIETLRLAWEKVYPQSAAGGRLALSGFHYQFLSALLESVQAWVQARSHGQADNGPSVFTETLSDLVRAESDEAIIVTQIKRSLTPAKVRDALRDLWSVHSIAAENAPNLLPLLRYRVQAARGDLSKVEAVAQTWAPSIDVAQEEVDRFLAALTADILADPEDDLLTLLANTFRAESPLDQIRTWLARLLEAAPGAEGFRIAATEIWNDLQRLSKEREKRPGGIYFWKASDRPPSDVIQGQVLTGERPQVHHLRKGYFANREALYMGLTDNIAEWTTQCRLQPDKTLRLPVFWIGGRSGCGKSAALLHVLAALYARGFGPILWLGNRPEKLPEAVRWCRHLQGPERQPLIAIDDPYAPDAQETGELWNAALIELEDLRQNGEGEALPLTICCGPTEQAQRLEEDYGTDLMLEQIELPREQADELQALHSWYRQRTNEDAPHLEHDEDVLLVQLFFQWRVGEPLRDFARRFLTRIQASDERGILEGVLARVLALNRLYAGYPCPLLHQALGPRLRGMLDRLRAEHHLAEYADARRHGVWLAHPHLSNAIYEAWYPGPNNIHVRAAHLKAAIDDSLGSKAEPSERNAPLWALSRALASEHAYQSDKADRIARRVDRAPTLGLLSEVYAKRAGSPDTPIATSELPVWVHLAAIAPDLCLEPHPADTAIRRLGETDSEERGLRLTCHKLLQHLDRFDEARRARATAAVASLLSRAPEWKEWAPVALDALWQTQQHEVASLIADWVVKRAKSLRTGGILLRALRIAPGDPDLLRAAEILLPGASASFDWGDVASHLLDRTDTPPEAVLQWTERIHSQVETCFVLGKLVRMGYEDAVPWGQTWAELWHGERSANYLLEPLWDRGASPDLLRKWCLVWIQNCPPGADASFVLEKLVRAFPEDREIRKVTREWMSGEPVKPSAWTHLWDALRKADHNDPELQKQGRRWLREAPCRHKLWQWLYVWEALRKDNPDDPELAALGRQWLKDAPPEHGSWAFVWGDLREDSPDDPELRALGRQWLKDAPPEHESWKYVWEALREDSPDDPELRALGRQWLKDAPPEHGSWAFVWGDLREDSPDDPELRALGRQWLKDAPPEHGSWAFVWEGLREDSPDDPELATLGRQWLKDAPPEHECWQFVWEALRKDNPDDPELAALGRQWLKDAPPEHGSWQFVWEALRKDNPDDSELLEQGRQWLRNVSSEHQSWYHVWKTLFDANRDDPELIKLGRQWLTDSPAAHTFWKFVWELLYERNRGDPELNNLGHRWLRDAPSSHGSWPYVWSTMHRENTQDQELQELGRRWISSVYSNHGGWNHIWKALRKDNPDDIELIHLGCEWLKEASATHGGWSYVWENLWRAQSSDSELAELGRQWLDQTPESHGSWIFVWKALRENSPEDSELAAAGQRWLTNVGTANPSWSVVWEDLYKQNADDPKLATLGREWLGQEEMTHASWSFVWQALIKSHPNDADLRALGRRFLVRVPPSNGSWPHTWRTCHEVSLDDTELEEECLAWLEKLIIHKSWIKAFEPLWNTGRHRDRLVGLACRRLEEMPDGKGSELLREILAEHTPDGSLEADPDASVEQSG